MNKNIMQSQSSCPSDLFPLSLISLETMILREDGIIINGCIDFALNNASKSSILLYFNEISYF